MSDMPECDRLTGRSRDYCRGERGTVAICNHMRAGWGFPSLPDGWIVPAAAPASRPATPQAGPGTELAAIFAAAGVPGCQSCHELAGRMNAWGSAGCREKLEQIVAEILPRAQAWLAESRPWVAGLLGAAGVETIALTAAIRRRVIAAIDAADRKRSMEAGPS